MEWTEENGQLVATGEKATYRIEEVRDVHKHYRLHKGSKSFGGAFASIEEAQARAEEVDASEEGVLP